MKFKEWNLSTSVLLIDLFCFRIKKFIFIISVLGYIIPISMTGSKMAIKLLSLFQLLLLHVIFLFPLSLHAKILIMTHSYNQPEFISYQYHTFNKFIEGEFDYIVFNDAPNDELFAQIENVCQQLHITSIPVPQIIHSLPYLFRDSGIGGPSAECAETIQFMLNSVGFKHSGIVMLVDSDMFLIRRLNVESFLQEYDIAAHPQYRTSSKGTASYFLPNLMIFNMEQLQDKAMFNFNLGEVNGVRTDTGGFNHYYIEQHPDLKWLKINVFYPPLNKSKTQPHPEALAELKAYPALYQLLQTSTYDYEFYADCYFLHFRAGSNWNNIKDVDMAKKTTLFFTAIGELLNVDFQSLDPAYIEDCIDSFND